MHCVTVNCSVCGGANHREFMEVIRRTNDGSGGTYRMAECLDCRFLYVNPRPAADELIQLYSSHVMYFRDDYEPISLEMPVLRRVIGDIQRFVKTGSLLEVGCGRGELLELASKSGFEAHGCDFQRSPALDSSVHFHVGTLQSSDFPDASFDCLVLRNTLEHLFDPADELRICHRLLKPGGFLYLKVPNAAYEHGWRCRLMWGRAHVFGPPWHLNYFTRSTLERFLTRNGFAATDWLIESPTPYPHLIRNVVQRTASATFRTARLLTFGTLFPQPLLTCLARRITAT